MQRFASILALLGAVGLTVVPLDVGATTVPAIAGKTWIDGEGFCMSSPSFSNRVTNTACTGPIAWLVPLAISTGTITFRAASAGSGTAPSCRYVLRSPGDGSVGLGPATTVSNADTPLGTLNVTSAGTTAHIDCTLHPNGRGLTAVRYDITPF